MLLLSEFSLEKCGCFELCVPPKINIQILGCCLKYSLFGLLLHMFLSFHPLMFQLILLLYNNAIFLFFFAPFPSAFGAI